MRRLRGSATVVTLLLAVGCTSESTTTGSGSREPVSTADAAPDGVASTDAASTDVTSVDDSTPGAGTTAAPTTTVAAFVADASLLPEPAADPGGDPSAAAAQLAAATVTGGEAGLAALLRALQRSGVGIVDGGVVVRPAGDVTQGLLLPAGDVLAAAALFPGPNLVSLDVLAYNVGTVLGLSMTDETAASLADHLVADLAGIASGADPALAFFARYLSALSVPASTPDLLTAASGRGVVLTGPQAILLLNRLAADIELTAPATAGFPGFTGFPGTASAATLAASPCQFDSKVLDTGTTAFNMALSKALDYLEDLGEDFSKFGGAMNLAGLITSIGKLIATAALFEAHLELLDAPLIRVMGPGNPGQQREVEATVEFKPNPAAWANCLGPMLQIFNADTGLPPEGPVKGGRIKWSGSTGFSTGTGTGYVEFYTLGGTAPSGPQGDLVSLTDDAGKARVGVEGIAPKELLPTWAPEYPRPFTVNAALDTRETDVYKNILSAFSQLTNPAIQPIVEAAVRGLIGMGVISRSKTFEIIDHAPDIEVAIPAGQFMMDGGLCKGDGTITLSGTDTSSGMPITADGQFVFDTDETGAGTFTFGVTMDADMGAVPIDASIEMSGSGDVQISAGEDLAVTIAVSNVTTSGSGTGSGPGMSISAVFPTDANGASSLSGTAGLFCE